MQQGESWQVDRLYFSLGMNILTECEHLAHFARHIQIGQKVFRWIVNEIFFKNKKIIYDNLILFNL